MTRLADGSCWGRLPIVCVCATGCMVNTVNKMNNGSDEFSLLISIQAHRRYSMLRPCSSTNTLPGSADVSISPCCSPAPGFRKRYGRHCSKYLTEQLFLTAN